MKKSMKRMVLICAAFVLFCAGMAVDASITYKSGSETKVYTGAYYKVFYEEKLVTDDAHPAVLINDNIMIPYKHCLKLQGPLVKSSFKKLTKKLTLRLGTNKVRMYLNKKYVYVNGKKKKIYTAPRYAWVNGVRMIIIPGKAICKALNINYSYVKPEKSVYLTKKEKAMVSSVSSSKELTAKDLQGLSTEQFIKLLGPIAQEDYKKTGILASVTLAQAINESGWGRTTLCQKGNNLFGMKISLSGNTWIGSTWDQVSYVSIQTKEEVRGKKVTVTARFRKYPNLAKSIADHSAYLSGAMNGSTKRYAGITSTTSYSKQLKILQKGGYCTWSSYVSELTSLIKKYNLTQFDVK